MAKEGEVSDDTNNVTFLDVIFYGIVPCVLFVLIFFTILHIMLGNIK